MVRFMQKGTTRFYFVPTIASAALAPTVAEIAAGTRMDIDLADVSGFQFQNNPIQTPDFASTFTDSIPGEDTAESSSVQVYEHKATAANPILTALPKGTTGFMAIFPRGVAGAAPVAAEKCDVWPIQVASNRRIYSAGNEASKYEIQFTMLDEPELEVSVLA